MGKKNDVPLKGKFRLWWEYFKRSDLYNRFREKTVRLFKSKDEINKTLTTASIEKWFAASIEEVEKDKTISMYPLILFKELIEGFSIDEWWEINIYISYLIKPEVSDMTTQVTLITNFIREHGDISTIFDPEPKTVNYNYVLPQLEMECSAI